MILFFEILLLLALAIGLLYFIFDFKEVVATVIALIYRAVILVIAGFFIGIGIHLTNLMFGW